MAVAVPLLQKWDMDNVEEQWEKAAGDQCPRCRAETLRFVEGLCPRCHANGQREAARKAETAAMKRRWYRELGRSAGLSDLKGKR